MQTTDHSLLHPRVLSVRGCGRNMRMPYGGMEMYTTFPEPSCRTLSVGHSLDDVLALRTEIRPVVREAMGQQWRSGCWQTM